MSLTSERGKIFTNNRIFGSNTKIEFVIIRIWGKNVWEGFKISTFNKRWNVHLYFAYVPNNLYLCENIFILLLGFVYLYNILCIATLIKIINA